MLPDVVPIFNGDFKAAQREAQQQVKFLCVLLVCSDHPSCNRSNLNLVLGKTEAVGPTSAGAAGGESLSEILRRRCIFWAADIDSDAAAAVTASLSPAAFPYVAVTFKSQLLMEIQGDFGADALRDALAACMADAEAEVAKEIAFAADRDARAMERDAHEAHLARLQETDRKREQEKRDAEEKKRREEDAEQERLQRLLREAEGRKQAEERARAEAEERRRRACSSVPDVPGEEVAADQVTTIRLTLPDGKNATRKFFRSAPLSGLYCWVESLPEYDPTTGCADYELVAGFPPQVLERLDDVPLSERKILIPRCAVTMRKK